MVDFTGSNRGGVRIKVTADTAKARADIARLGTSFKGVQQTASSATDSIKRMALTVGTLFAGGALTKGINGATDGLTDMENQIALVVGRGKELQQQMDVIYKIAKETKAPVSATAESFSRMGRAMKEAGASTEDINKAVITLNRASTISGGAVESQRAALFQLSQGFASGTLRGEELNSVMEQLPRVAQVISDELGLTIGQLRGIAQEGQLTSEVVFGALLNQSEAVNAEFGNINLTSGKAFALLKDQVSRLVAELSKATGFTDGFTRKLVFMAEFIDGNRDSIVQSVVKANEALKDFIARSKEMATAENAMRFVRNLFTSVKSLAQEYLGQAERYIDGWSKRISDYFFRIYDEVIGHSWWTDTMIETYDLAKEYLSKTAREVANFARDAIDKFQNLYNNSKGSFGIKLEATLEGLNNFRQNIGTAISEGVDWGLRNLIGLDGKIRQALVNGLMGAFVLVFGGGGLMKALQAFAKRLGPLMWAGLAASFVDNFLSPGVTGVFGFVAGEFVGQIMHQLVSAVPEMMVNAVYGLGGAIAGIFNTAGIAKGIIGIGALLMAVSKDFRKSMLGTFAALWKGMRHKGTAGGLFSGLEIDNAIKENKLKGMQAVAFRTGAVYRLSLARDINWATTAMRMNNIQAGRLSVTLGTVLTRATQGAALAFRKYKGALFGSLIAMGLFVSDAFAATGDMNEAMKTMISPDALILGLTALLSSGAVRAKIAEVGLMIGSWFSMAFVKSVGVAMVAKMKAAMAAAQAALIAATITPMKRMVSAMVAQLTLAVAAARARFIMAIVSPLKTSMVTAGTTMGAAFANSWIVGAVRGLLGRIAGLWTAIKVGIAASFSVAGLLAGTALAVTGGLAWIILFGEGDTFMEKLDDTIKDIGAKFGMLNVADFQTSVDFKKRAATLGRRGQLQEGSFQNASLSRQIADLNFSSLSDSNAREMITQLGKLDALQQKAAQEQARYNQVSETTNNQILEVQKALLNATREAQANQAPVGEAMAGSLNSAIDTRIGTFEKIGNAVANSANNVVKFLGGGSIISDELEALNIARDLINNNAMETSEDIRTLVTNLRDITGANFTELFGEEIGNAIEAMTKNPFDQEVADTFAELIRAVDDREKRSGMLNFADREEAVDRALADFTDSINSAGHRLTKRSRAEQIEYLKSTNPELSNLDLGAIVGNDKTLGNIVNMQKTLQAFETRLSNAITAENPSEDIIQSVSERVIAIREQLKKAISQAIKQGFDEADVGNLMERFSDAGLGSKLSEKFINQINSGASGNSVAGQFKAAADELKDIEQKISDIQTGATMWEADTANVLANLVAQKDALSQHLGLMANIQETLQVEPEEVEGLATEAATLSGVNVNLDKMFAVDPATKQGLAETTALVMALKAALASGSAEALASAGASSVEDAVTQITNGIGNLKSTFKNLAGGILKPTASGGGADKKTDWERLIEGTGLAMEEAGRLGAKEANKIVTALKSIEASEKAINKLAISNVDARRKQLENIRKQNDMIQETLMQGTFGQAQQGLSNLGLDPELAKGGVMGIEAGMRMLELQRELNALNINDYQAIYAKTQEILKQEEIIDRIIEKENTMKDDFIGSLKSNISDFIKSGDLKGAFFSLMDDVTSSIIDSFVDGLVDALMKSKMMTNFFDNLFNPDTFKKLGESLAGILGNLGGGGGGGLMSIFSSFLGRDQGGEIPLVPGAQHGKDSVPTMLKPGERVLSKNDLRNGSRGAFKNGGNNTTVNLEIVGDVSRQTRREVLSMIPQITQGVNNTNKEKNYKG